MIFRNSPSSHVIVLAHLDILRTARTLAFIVTITVLSKVLLGFGRCTNLDGSASSSAL